LLKCRLLTLLLLVSAAFIPGCSNQPASVTDYASLVRNLSKPGITVEPGGTAEQHAPDFQKIFSGTERYIKLNNENLNIWEFHDEATAQTEAKFVKFNGFDICRPPDSDDEGFAFHVDWIAPPHWYTTGRIIVLYAGEKQETLSLLKDLLGLPFAGQGKGLPPVTDYTSLIDNLLTAGLIVKARGDTAFPANSPDEPIFSGTGRRIEVNSENISVLEYEDEVTAQTEAKFISPDGCAYTPENGNVIINISWIAPPHFFLSGKIIVLYIGENQTIIDLLESVMGTQFAGM